MDTRVIKLTKDPLLEVKTKMTHRDQHLVVQKGHLKYMKR